MNTYRVVVSLHLSYNFFVLIILLQLLFYNFLGELTHVSQINQAKFVAFLIKFWTLSNKKFFSLSAFLLEQNWDKIALLVLGKKCLEKLTFQPNFYSNFQRKLQEQRTKFVHFAWLTFALCNLHMHAKWQLTFCFCLGWGRATGWEGRSRPQSK